MVDGLGEGLAFALGWVRNPRRVGAIAPASRALAQAMADEVARIAPDRLVEVGAGTGAITQALAQLNLGPSRFQVVERDPGFVRRLHERFPQADVVHGCASQLDRLATDPKTSLVIVSSLPLMSMPREETQGCVRAMHALLDHHTGARLLQYYPMSIATDQLGLNISAFSYNDRLWISVVACRNMLPDPAFFIDCLHKSFQQLLAAGGHPASTNRHRKSSMAAAATRNARTKTHSDALS